MTSHALPFIRIETSDGETRWINVEHIVRSTLAREVTTGELILALTLSTDQGQPVLRIHGTDDVNRHAIDQVVHALEGLSMPMLPVAA